LLERRVVPEGFEVYVGVKELGLTAARRGLGIRQPLGDGLAEELDCTLVVPKVCRDAGPPVTTPGSRGVPPSNLWIAVFGELFEDPHRLDSVSGTGSDHPQGPVHHDRSPVDCSQLSEGLNRLLPAVSNPQRIGLPPEIGGPARSTPALRMSAPEPLHSAVGRSLGRLAMAVCA
jgi:hypothetical protein